MESVIKIENLKKNYGKKEVLKRISLDIKRGEIFALLGINGAGKTTTLECIEGLRKFDSGSIEINGSFGVQLQSSSLPKNIKAIEAIKLFAKWKKTKIKDEDLVKLGVDKFKNKQYYELSTGQKRRLHLAMAILGEPDIIFLDEPTAGLDVEGKLSIHEEIRKLKAKGHTIVLASHDMAEVEDLSDRLAIIKSGEIAFLGSSLELTEQSKNLMKIKIRFNNSIDINYFSNISKEKEYFVFETSNLEKELFNILDYCKKNNIFILDIETERTGITERFLEISRENK